MERGGCASLRSLPCCPLLSRSRSRPLRGTPRPGKPPQRSIPTPPLAKKLRSYICSQEKRYCVISKTFEKSHVPLRVFSTHGPQEANLSTEETRKDKFLIDCENDQECVVGGIVALGKFDALHIGHRQLAIQASKAGIPFLLSFVGMAEVLGWEFRAPIVAKCDRKRVLTSWAPSCGNIVPLEFQVEFSNVRHLTPRQFVERLSTELRISGVVAGENYRFGYKASGDAPELLRLCNEYGLSAYIVKSVMDKNRRTSNGASTIINPGDRGQVSSSRVRYALAMGDMEYVEELLGRKHRLVLKLDEECQSTGTRISAPKSCQSTGTRISAPKSCMLNQPPKDGMYDRCTLLGDDFLVGRCNVIIKAETIDIDFDGHGFSTEDFVRKDQLISMEFG